MKYTKYLFKLLFLAYVTVELACANRINLEEILILLVIVAVIVFKERFCNSVYTSAAFFLVITAAAFMNPSFGILYCITAFDFIYEKVYIAMVPVMALSIYFLYGSSKFFLFLLLMGTSVLAAYVAKMGREREERYKISLDEERRLRYELEQAKAKLLNTAKETAYLAEIKERNRIARDIHDNIGHSIAGILIQLQASFKLYDKDSDKSRDILKKSIEGLSTSLEMLRDTVHNIKPRENLGVEYIKKIIEGFDFCPVDFRFSGDFGMLPPNHLEILGTNVKEALTNAAKHSGASKVEIVVDINQKFTRLYIRDNGRGCRKIKEGLGLSGMKERIWNIGGSISISTEDGFMIVCLIPGAGDDNEGSGAFEGSDSR